MAAANTCSYTIQIYLLPGSQVSLGKSKSVFNKPFTNLSWKSRTNLLSPVHSVTTNCQKACYYLYQFVGLVCLHKALWLNQCKYWLYNIIQTKVCSLQLTAGLWWHNREEEAQREFTVSWLWVVSEKHLPREISACWPHCRGAGKYRYH